MCVERGIGDLFNRLSVHGILIISLLLILTFSISSSLLSYAQHLQSPFKVMVAPEEIVISKPSKQDFSILLINGGERREINVFVLLVRDRKVIEGKNFLFSLEPMETLNLTCSFTFESSLEAGVYNLTVKAVSGVTELKISSEIYILPSDREINGLFKDYVEVKSFFEGVEPFFMGREGEANLSTLLKETARKIKEDIKLFEEKKYIQATKLYDEIKKSFYVLKERKREAGRSIFIYKLLSSIENNLNFDAKIILGFWFNFIIGSLAIFLVFLFIFPIYTSKPYVWIENSALLFYNTRKSKSSDLIPSLRRSVGERINFLLRQAHEMTNVNVRVLSQVAVASFMAAIGLLTDNIAALIGSMLIAPIMVISTANTYGWVLSDEEMSKGITGAHIFREGFMNELKVLFLAIFTSYVCAWILTFFIPLVPSQFLMSRATPNLSDLAVAIGAGLAGAVSISGRRKEISMLVGAAIAVALIPPASAIGIGLALLRADVTFGAISLLMIEVIAIKFSSYLAAVLYILYPLFKQVYSEIKTFWSHQDVYSIASFIKNLVIYWTYVSLSIVPSYTGGGEAKGFVQLVKEFRPLIFKTLRKFTIFVITPLTLIWLFGLIVSTQVSAWPSLLIESLTGSLSNLYSLLFSFVDGNVLLVTLIELIKGPILGLLFPLFIFLVSFYYSYRTLKSRERKIRNTVCLMISLFLIWLLTAHHLNLKYFPRALTIYSLIFILGGILILTWSKISRYKSRILLYGFIIFSLLYITLQSVQVYQGSVYSASLTGINRFSKGIISVYLGIPEEKVLVDSSLRGKTLYVEAEIYVNLMELQRYQLNKEKIEQLNRILTENTGYRTRVTLKYIVSSQ